jgi:transposase
VPPIIAQLREVTRDRPTLVHDRARDTPRIPRLLEDAGITLDSVVGAVLGQSARQRLEGLIAGVGEPGVRAESAPTRMRPKIERLRLAWQGRFGEHHALMVARHLAHIDPLSAAISRIDAEVDRLLGPFAAPARRLQTIPGVGKRTTEVIIAEIGVDLGRLPTAGQLVCWAGRCPGNDESAGRRRSGRARKGDTAVRSALCEPAWAASRTHSYLGAQYRHLLPGFGKKGQTKAAFAVGHTIVVIVWQLLVNDCDYQDLGADYVARRDDAEACKRYLVCQLEALGHRVSLIPAA